MSHRRNRHPNAVGVIVALVIFAFTAAIIHLEAKLHRQNREEGVDQWLNSVGDILKESLNRRLFLAEALSAFVQNSREVEEAEFMGFSSRLLESAPEVRSLQLAPDSVVTYVYPLAGNEAAVEHDLLNDSERRDDVDRAIQTGNMVLAGPFELRQGGTGLIGRVPIFLHTPGQALSEGQYWGLAVVVVDLQPILQEAGLYRGTGMRFAIRKKDGTGDQAPAFAGDSAVFHNGPRVRDISLPGGSWQLAAIPHGGWPPFSPLTPWLLGGSSVLALMSGALAAIRLKRREETARYELLSEHTHDMILFIQSDERILDANQAGIMAFGYERMELIGRSVHDLLAPVEGGAPPFHDPRKKAVIRSFEVVLRRRDNSTFPAKVSSLSASLHERPISLWIIRDISERKTLESQLKHQAFHDGLTKLPNRDLLMVRLERALLTASRKGTRVGLLIINLDHFKFFNDSLGHTEGDRLLKAISHRLRDCVRMGDTLARMGGDEFTVLLADITTAAEATAVAEKIAFSMNSPIILSGQKVFVSASVGVALSSDLQRSAEDLLRDADVAMYSAKRIGKGKVAIFDPDMHDHAREFLELQADLRRAIDRQEFKLLYQPLVKLESGMIVGAEALLRWDHPIRGTLSPADFIQVAEETELIIPIGKWVRAEAFRQARDWEAAFPDCPPIYVNINLSAREFQQPDLVETVAETLAQTGANPHGLQIEITESTMMQGDKSAAVTLQKLRELGLRIAIDDFGTGYSSLGYLKHLPLDTIKIDRSFINDVDEQSQDLAIIQAIVTLASALRLRVTAEGIEREEQAGALSSLGCDHGQGYYFSPPLPAERLTAQLLRNRRFPVPQRLGGHGSLL